jgi:hypothetical protein
MSGIITATAKFTPGDTSRVLDLFVQVKLFAKVQRSQAVVVEEAQRLAPNVTGELVASIAPGPITNEGYRLTGTVVAASGHAGFVEFGTGLTGSGTYPYPLPQEGVPITGSWIYDYKNQNWVGMVAQPYLRPALDVARTAILGEFQS